MCGRIGYGTLILVLLLGACGGDARSPELQTAGQAESSTGSPALPEAGTATGNGTAPAADTSLEMEIDLPAALREIAALQTPENVDAEVFEELKAELARVLREQAAPERLVAAASDEEVFKPLDVHLRVDHSERRLRWLYELPGDYDQNGEVNAADLVPLAFRLGVKAPDPGGDFAFGSRERITDGKRDGEINISDVSPVGRNFGRHSDGFAVYGSEDLQDFPFDFSQLSMAPLATVDQQGIVVEAGRQGYFELELAGELRSFYWVRQITDGSPGDPSFIAKAGEVLSTGYTRMPPYRQRGTQLQYDAGAGTANWRYVFMGDAQRIGECNVSAITVVGGTFGQSKTDYIMNGRSVDPDCNRDGVVDFEDINSIALLLGSAYDGYRLYHAETDAQLPDGYWGEEKLQPVLEVPFWEIDPLGADTVQYSAGLPFTPASGSYLYLRPYDNSGELGPVCEFVEVQ